MASGQTRPSEGDNSDLGTLPSDARFLDDVGLVEVLEQDRRPTFILDLQSPGCVAQGSLTVIFRNKSLRLFKALPELLVSDLVSQFAPPATSPGGAEDQTTTGVAKFQKWATTSAGSDAPGTGCLEGHRFYGIWWSSITLCDRWRLIGTSQVPRRQADDDPGYLHLIEDTASASCTQSENSESEDDEPSEKPGESMVTGFRVMAETSLAALCYLSPEGDVIYANDMWYEITGHPKVFEGKTSFVDVISEPYRQGFADERNALTTQGAKRMFEIQLESPSTGVSKPKWILVSLSQDPRPKGKLGAIIGYITDITSQKEAERAVTEKINLAENLSSHKEIIDLAPCGIFILDPQGALTWANTQWYEMVRSSNQADHNSKSFLRLFEEGDRETIRDKLIVLKKEMNMQLCLRRFWAEQDGVLRIQNGPPIILRASPQLDERGNLIKIFGCMVDNNRQNNCSQRTRSATSQNTTSAENADGVRFGSRIGSGTPQPLLPSSITAHLNPQSPGYLKPGILPVDTHSVLFTIQSKYQILLAEDHPIVQRYITRQLERAGCTVYIANHGVEVLDILTNTTFWHEADNEPGVIDLSLIIMDLAMPVMGGMECIRQIRAMEQEGKIIGHVPIIGMAASSMPLDQERMIEEGADHSIMKLPFPAREVVQFMSQLMARKHFRSTKL